MKAKYILLIGISAIFLLYFDMPLFADISISGELETNNQMMIEKGKILNNRNSLSVQLALMAEYYSFFANPVIKVEGLPKADQIDDLQDPEIVLESSIILSEAYIDLYEFILPSIDIRFGKQLIIWGTADKLNPTGNICPFDLSDALRFGEKLGINSILLNAYISELTFSAVFTPVFIPSILPRYDLLRVLIPGIPPISGTTRGTQTDFISAPKNELGESSQFAVKTALFFTGFDFSLSYFYGRYSIPVMYRIDLTQSGSVTNIETYSKFPKVHVIGFDFAGSIFDMSIWGEAGIFFPKKVTTETHITGIGLVDSTDSVRDKAYIRYVLGTDYSFRRGLYYNIQFVHGFDYEIGHDNLNDYLIGRLEKDFFYDKLKILPLTIILSSGDLKNLKIDYGIGWLPEIQFFPFDNVEIDLGAFLIEGKGDTILEKLNRYDSIFFTLKVSF